MTVGSAQLEHSASVQPVKAAPPSSARAYRGPNASSGATGLATSSSKIQVSQTITTAPNGLITIVTTYSDGSTATTIADGPRPSATQSILV
jgi:hypothetical protein